MYARRASRYAHAVLTAAVLLIVVPVGAVAQATQEQWWTEVDLFWRPSEQIRLFGLARITRAEENHYREGTFGLHVDYVRFSRAFARLGYNYVSAIPDTSDRENRGVAELTVHQPFGQSRFVNRARVDLRWRSADFSWRLRERVRLERTVTTIWRQELVPYVMDEIYYDSRYRSIVRNRLNLGAALSVNPHVRVGLSYVRQDDSRATVRHVNAVEVKLELSYSDHK